ncbi:MAG: FAD:protein FMN transferase, partial [Gemmiger sp.]
FDIYNHYDGVVNLADVNGAAGSGPVKVSEEILDLLRLGKRMYEVTGGKCNVAGGAVLSLWHDARTAAGEDPDHAALPDESALKAAAAHCDMTDLILDEAAGTVQFADSELKLDVGAIGKGYAVEAAARAAEASGVESMLLNVGGNVRAIGTKPGGEYWTAGIEDPWPDENGNYNTAAYVLAVEMRPGQCLVTSGDYQRYFTVDGVNYAHLIDPDTLYPARYVSSVTVLCTDSGEGDGLSTGLFCTDVESGRTLAERLDGVEVLWLGTDGAITETSGFAEQTFDPNGG